MKGLKVIYEPQGRAAEYADLAANLFQTCNNRCEYCYVPKVLRKTKEEFFQPARPRPGIIKKLSADVAALRAAGDRREILLCFTCDPYPSDIDQSITRQALETLLSNGLNVSILTKGGSRSLEDLDLLKNHKNQVTYGATLVFADNVNAEIYEPGAASITDRIRALKEVHNTGIRTWVSMEPAWSINDAQRIIYKTHEFVDIYKLGKLNYHPHANNVDWVEYHRQVTGYLYDRGKEFILKDDLKKYAGKGR